MAKLNAAEALSEGGGQAGAAQEPASGPPGPPAGQVWAALLVYRYLSNAASFVLRVVYSVKDHHGLLRDSPLLKKTCIRQVVSDKWFPLTGGRRRAWAGVGGARVAEPGLAPEESLVDVNSLM